MARKPKFKVTDKDRGYARIFENMRESRGVHVNIGVMGSKAQETYPGEKTTNLLVATVHEFGLGVPKRSFLRDTVSMNEKKIKANLDKAVEMIAKGKPPVQTLARLGLWFEGVIKQRIAKGTGFKKLAESTIERKGSSKPLIDTGQLRNSITSEVVE